jgi:Proteins of 100 residues with WXG
MSGIYGANPEQLEQLGNTLKRQIESINSVISTVTSTFDGTTWSGPARDRFLNDWNGSFRTALIRLNEAFEAAGQDCVLRTQELRRVMGAA